MEFESDRQEAEWSNPAVHPKLRELVAAAEEYAATKRWAWLVTSIWRSPAEDAALEGSGVHTEWRALDIRTRDVSAQVVADVTRWINDRWKYDPTRPDLRVAISEPHGTGPHLHLQVHERTTRP